MGNFSPTALCCRNFLSISFQMSLPWLRSSKLPMQYMPCLARDNATHIRLLCFKKPICPELLLRTKDSITILDSNPWNESTVEAFKDCNAVCCCNYTRRRKKALLTIHYLDLKNELTCFLIKSICFAYGLKIWISLTSYKAFCTKCNDNWTTWFTS